MFSRVRNNTDMTQSLTTILLIAVITATGNGDRTVLYPKYKSGGLVCYQDRREDGGAFWAYANEQQRRPHVFHCPSSLSSWCVKMLTGQLSVRGCSGPTGINKAGCFHVIDANVTSKVCLCKRDYCNVASRHVTTLMTMMITTTTANAF